MLALWDKDILERSCCLRACCEHLKICLRSCKCGMKGSELPSMVMSMHLHRCATNITSMLCKALIQPFTSRWLCGGAVVYPCTNAYWKYRAGENEGTVTCRRPCFGVEDQVLHTWQCSLYYVCPCAVKVFWCLCRNASFLLTCTGSDRLRHIQYGSDVAGHHKNGVEQGWPGLGSEWSACGFFTGVSNICNFT